MPKVMSPTKMDRSTRLECPTDFHLGRIENSNYVEVNPAIQLLHLLSSIPIEDVEMNEPGTDTLHVLVNESPEFWENPYERLLPLIILGIEGELYVYGVYCLDERDVEPCRKIAFRNEPRVPGDTHTHIYPLSLLFSKTVRVNFVGIDEIYEMMKKRIHTFKINCVYKYNHKKIVFIRT